MVTARDHTYDLFVDRRRAGRLEWRSHLRCDTGWYLVRAGVVERLQVDASIEELARDERTPVADWKLNAELAALLSTPLALDVSEHTLHGRPEQRSHRFRRPRGAVAVEIYLDGIERSVLAHAVPELPVAAVSDVSMLAGTLHPEAVERILRRVALLGGQIIAIFREDEPELA